MDDTVRAYIDGIDPAHRPLFDRLDRLIRAAYPDVTVALSYQIPTYRVGRRHLYVGAWKHGVSIYGWGQDRDGGFTDRHPDLVSGKGTIQLTPVKAADLPDDDLGALIRAAFAE
jgi:uncharacterized protein YdhG (YjbR/CyaY superfamily)